MNFQLTDEQKLLASTVRQFGEHELKPRAARVDELDEFPNDLLPALREAGFLGLGLPVAFGGGGGDLMDLVIVMEEAGRSLPASGFIISCQSGFGPKTIALFGTDQQKERYLPSICSGDMLVAWAMSEPSGGSDIGSMHTVVQQENGRYVMRGQKTWISLAHVAHLFVVIARFGDRPGLDGLGAVIIERGTPGLTLGAKIRTLGLRGTGMGGVFFEDCPVPEENILIEPGGFRNVLSIMSGERVTSNPPMSLGLAEAALQAAIEFVQERVQFGRRLAEFQGLRWKLADMAIKLDAARMLVYRAATNADAGIPVLREASIAKVAANEAAIQIVDTALQLHGAAGYSCDLPLERMLRDARGLSIGDGTVEIQRNQIAAEILGRRR